LRGKKGSEPICKGEAIVFWRGGKKKKKSPPPGGEEPAPLEEKERGTGLPFLERMSSHLRGSPKEGFHPYAESRTAVQLRLRSYWGEKKGGRAVAYLISRRGGENFAPILRARIKGGKTNYLPMKKRATSAKSQKKNRGGGRRVIRSRKEKPV